MSRDPALKCLACLDPARRPELVVKRRCTEPELISANGGSA